MVKGAGHAETISALSGGKPFRSVLELNSASLGPAGQAGSGPTQYQHLGTQIQNDTFGTGGGGLSLQPGVTSAQQLAMFMPQPYTYPSMQQALHPVYGPSPYFYSPGYAAPPHGFNPVAMPYFPAAPAVDPNLRTAYPHPAPGGFMSQDYVNWYEGLIRPVTAGPAHGLNGKEVPLDAGRSGDAARADLGKVGELEKSMRSGKRDVRMARRHTDGPSSAPSADVILEDFKNNKSLKLEFTDIFGHLVAFSRDQHGSRFIQQKLESVSIAERDAALQEILPKCMELMQDVFGNYVIQKFLEFGTESQKELLAGKMKGNVLALTHQMYGCRVVQKALEVCNLTTRIGLVSELMGPSIVDKAVRDQNGNHVIQKVIEFVPTEHITFIIDVFIGQVATLSSHLFGCRVIQRVLEHCQDAVRKEKVMKEILEATEKLAQDQYGNYVIQHVLQHGTPEQRHQVVQKLASQLVSLSSHKFASNVVEKCLEYGRDEAREALLKQLLSGDENDTEGALQQMSKDQYANYVVQKLLEVVSAEQKEMLLARVRAHLHSLKKMPYGKHIVSRVEKLLSTGSKLYGAKSRHSQAAAGLQRGVAALSLDDNRGVPVLPASVV